MFLIIMNVKIMLIMIFYFMIIITIIVVISKLLPGEEHVSVFPEVHETKVGSVHLCSTSPNSEHPL